MRASLNKRVACFALGVGLGIGGAGFISGQTIQADAQNPKIWQKRPGLNIKFGSFLPSLNTTFRIDGAEGRGTTINLGDALKFRRSQLVIQGEGEFRIADWLGVEARFHQIKRSKTVTIDRELTIGDHVFDIDESLSADFITDNLGAGFKFYLVRRERLDLGFWAGANIVFFNLKFQVTGDLARIEARDFWAPIPAVGAHFSYTLLPRLYLYGKAGYFYYRVKDKLKFDSPQFDIYLDYFIWKSLGLGASFQYNKFLFERASAKFTGMISHRSSGFQFYGVIGF